MHAGCGVLVECLMWSRGQVHSGCCAVVVTPGLPVTVVGRLRVAVLVRCVMCVHRGGVPAGMWVVS